MVIDRRASTPLYLQLKDAISSEIREGGLKPGDRVGSESELERAHGVSRITVRQALGALAQQGEVYRVPGKGTYVASPKVAPLAAFTSFSENMTAQGLAPSYRVLGTGWGAPPGPVRDELRLGPAEEAFRLDRLLLADGEPIGIQRGYYPGRWLAPARDRLTPEALGTTSLYRLLEQRLGLRLWKAEETVEPAIATREEVGLLGIPRGTPVLVVKRLSFLATGEPVEAVTLVFRGDNYRYRIDLYRGQPADDRPAGSASLARTER